jgi:hypothetical protein
MLRTPQGHKNMMRTPQGHQKMLRTPDAHQESKNAGLGEAKRRHSVFLYLQITHFFCRILKSYECGLCCAGNIFLIAFPLVFIPCSNSGRLIFRLQKSLVLNKLFNTLWGILTIALLYNTFTYNIYIFPEGTYSIKSVYANLTFFVL